METKEDLIELIQENPTLPLFFMVSNDGISDDYGLTLHTSFTCKVETIYFIEHFLSNYEVFVGKEEALEKAKEVLADDEKYENLTDEEFEKYAEDYIEKNLRHYEAIIIYTEP